MWHRRLKNISEVHRPIVGRLAAFGFGRRLALNRCENFSEGAHTVVWKSKYFCRYFGRTLLQSFLSSNNRMRVVDNVGESQRWIRNRKHTLSNTFASSTRWFQPPVSLDERNKKLAHLCRIHCITYTSYLLTCTYTVWQQTCSLHGRIALEVQAWE